MRKYESVVVFHPSLSEVQVQDELKKFETLLSANGAKEISVDNWNKKGVLQRMEKPPKGTYICLGYNCDNHSVVETLTNILRISDGVAKFQTHLLSSRKRKFKGNPKRVTSAGNKSWSSVEDSTDEFFEETP